MRCKQIQQLHIPDDGVNQQYCCGSGVHSILIKTSRRETDAEGRERLKLCHFDDSDICYN